MTENLTVTAEVVTAQPVVAQAFAAVPPINLPIPLSNGKGCPESKKDYVTRMTMQGFTRRQAEKAHALAWQRYSAGTAALAAAETARAAANGQHVTRKELASGRIVFAIAPETKSKGETLRELREKVAQLEAELAAARSKA